MPYIGTKPSTANFSDLNGAKLILDADADTSITADTDDQIDIEIAGANDFTFAANAFNVLSGSTLTIDSGATITNSGTANGFGSSNPTSANGQALGSASLEWSDLFLADGSVIYFGADQEIKVTHVADTGLTLKHTATADDKPISLTLQTGETDMAANDIIGAINFQAPDEGTGTDAVLVAASIKAYAEGDFSSSSNATTLGFYTGASEAAAIKMTLSSGGNLDVTGDVTGSTINADGDTAAGDNAAIGYTAAEGLILTGQGSTDDITIKNDADTTIVNVATGGTDVEISAGNIIMGTASKGIYLGVTSATAANLLDDYEMGSFTVTILDAGLDSDGQTYHNQTGYYTKIGSQVRVNGLVRLAGAGNLSGGVNLGGFPFTTINTAYRIGVVTCGYMTGGQLAATGQTITGVTAQNATHAPLYEWDSTEGTTGLDFGNFSANNYFWFSCVYTAA